MPATPDAELRTKTLTSKKMPAQNYQILWWTSPPTPPPYSPYATSAQTVVDPEQGEGAWLPFTLNDCGLPYTCTFSEDRQALAESASVVLFAGSKLNDQDRPTVRNETQAWVLNTGKKTVFVTVFESTVVDAVIKPPPVSLSEKNRLRGLAKEQGGKAPAVWVTNDRQSDAVNGTVSECFDAPSGRESYIKELLKMMDIDIYGGCMENTVRPVHADTQKPWTAVEIMEGYKFVFALEPVNCEDYVSQGLADALKAGAIPIVDGPKDYSRFTPAPNAFVQLNTFISPELLAQELDSMDRDDTLYMDRLNYRIHGLESAAGTLSSSSSSTSSSEATNRSQLSSLFLENFSRQASKDTVATEAESSHSNKWEPNRHGAYCGICQLAHDLAEKEYDWTAHTSRVDSTAASGSPCESMPRYLPGLPVQMKAYDEYLQQENERKIHKGQSASADGGDRSTATHSVKVTVDLTKNVSDSSVWIQTEDNQSKAQEFSQIGSHSPTLEVNYLLLLILVLGVGMLTVALIPRDEHESMSLERMMLHELGEDLLYD
ncbi:hypothetical protein BGX28_009725 [Mortierella sp. GBA30]|nr:hypothetical protein BGX28_009725 [Mortierella sp. GBA30]